MHNFYDVCVGFLKFIYQFFYLWGFCLGVFTNKKQENGGIAFPFLAGKTDLQDSCV